MIARATVFALLGWLALALPAWAQAVEFATIVGRIEAGAEKVLAAYEPSEGAATAEAFSDLYFDVFEGAGMEAAVGARDVARKSELESRFGAVIGLASRGAATDEVTAAWERLRQLLRQTAQEQAMAGSGAAIAFAQGLLILLREGFEALLVVGALAAYLRRLGAADRLKLVWGGAAAALAASLAAAWLLHSVVRLSGKAQEAVEGLAMLLAALVLAYVSHWLFAKRAADKWQIYVKAQVERAVSAGQALSLGLAAFLAVFREGAETILFYQALLASAPGQEAAVLGGFVAGAVALGAIYLLMKVLAVRLPLGLFFGGTGILLYVLAVIFAGGGVQELQVAGWIDTTPVAAAPTVPWLGLFPTVESLAAQAALLVVLLPMLAMWAARRRAIGTSVR